MVYLLLFPMVVCIVYHDRTIEVVMFIVACGKGVSIVDSSMRREGLHDNKCKHHVKLTDCSL